MWIRIRIMGGIRSPEICQKVPKTFIKKIIKLVPVFKLKLKNYKQILGMFPS